MFDREEVAISDEGPVLGYGWLHMMSVILLGLGLYVGYRTMKVDTRIGAAIMIGGAMPAAITALLVTRLFRKIGRAQLMMKEAAVPLGWSGTVAYLRPLRGGATLRAVEARLQCEEHVEKGSGRSHREWREVVVDEPLSPQSTPMMEQLRLQIPIRIPVAGPPTFQYTDNEIIWWVRLRLTMEGCPNTRSSFRVRVAPAAVGQ